MSNGQRTPFEEDVEDMTRQIFFLQDLLDKTPKGSPKHEVFLRNLAAVSVLKAATESLLGAAKKRSFTEGAED